MKKADVLAIGAHPDDVELGCGGSLAKFVAQGKSVAILDLTRGEMGTRGTPEVRAKEAAKAAEILGVIQRAQANLPDGWISNSAEHQMEVIKWIRYFQPTMLLINAPNDRHPDHPHAAQLCLDAAFKSGLQRVETFFDGEKQPFHRPKTIFHYIQFWNIQPDVVMDISGHLETKIESVKAYASQFYQENSEEPSTPISSKNFWESVRYRALDMGRHIYTDAAEGFISPQPLGCNSLMDFR